MFSISLVDSCAENYTKKLNACVVKASCGYVFSNVSSLSQRANGMPPAEQRLDCVFTTPEERREPAVGAFQCCTMHTYTRTVAPPDVNCCIR